MQKKKKKRGRRGSLQLRKSPVHSLKASQRNPHTTQGGRGEGGEIQQQQKLSTLCNNLTHKNALKPPRRHQQSLPICQEGTGSFSPLFSCNKRGCKDSNSAHCATSCTQTSRKHSSSPTPGALLPLPRSDPPLTTHGHSTTAPFLCRELRCIRH